MNVAKNISAYRDRQLAALTLAQVAALPDKARATVLVITGAIEQHGPHLPVAVDALLGEAWLTRIFAQLPPSVHCYVAPPITIGKSNEHTGFPGTLSISKETLRAQLLALARQLHVWGFRRLAVLNTHGGNAAVVTYVLREISATYAMRAGILRPPFDFGLAPQEAKYGYHAGELETACLLTIAPQHVDMTQARCEFPARLDDPGSLRPEAAPARFAWVSADVSTSGIMGDATAAARANGERWLAHGAERFAAAILALND
jgi:creatinine amidohydrolase